MSKEIDILVFGATGFTGNLVTRYMNNRYSDGNTTWGIAGLKASYSVVAQKRIMSSRNVVA